MHGAYSEGLIDGNPGTQAEQARKIASMKSDTDSEADTLHKVPVVVAPRYVR